MSDPLPPRRQPPSPLVFSPSSVLSSASLATNGSNTGTSTVSHLGSGSNTVSMPFVRRHVTRRLKAAKAECDKELHRVTNSITTFFEENLREGDHESQRELRDRERGRERDRDSQNGDLSDALREPFILNPADLRSALQTDESGSDGGYDAELDYSRNTRHAVASPAQDEDASPPPIPASSAPALAHWASSPGLLTASSVTSSASSLRRQHTLPRDKPLSASVDLTSPPPLAPSPVSPPESSNNRKQNSILPSSWSMQRLSRRLSRTIHIPPRPAQSSQSSRSTSRSRSPLPPSTQSSYSEHLATTSANRRSSRILVDDPIDPIMTTLYALIGVATDIIDMTVTQLTSQPKICETLVQRVQIIGKAWDEHPDWHGRNWYVQVLLAVASLSRVVEWWEAEKQFWNFDDNDDEQDEPLMFVTKPVDDTDPVVPSPFKPPDTSALFLDENKLSSARPLTHARKSRDEHPKSLLASGTPHRDNEKLGRGGKLLDHNESARILATERLRLQAETAQNQNIILELNLDGDQLRWANYAWRVVVGTDPDELAGTRISQWLAPQDKNVFKEANQRLREDDSRTVEVRFKLQVEPEYERETYPGKLYQQMDGKGMLMFDREDGQPTHTMWVMKPIAAPRYELDYAHATPSSGEMDDDMSYRVESIGDRHPSVPVTPFPFNEPFSTEPILCRICESQIPQWYFEKHSETCAEVHRLEAEIAECNESISELRNTIRELCSTLDQSSPVAVAEYRGMPIFTPSTSPIIVSPLQLFRANKIQRMNVKKIQRRTLDQLEETLQVALEVSVPSLKEEEAKEPIERQRLLSPSSERKMSTVRNWSKPSPQDSALAQLVEDADRVMRQKVDNVVRMQNTIRYAEKIWREWEEKAERFGAESDSDDGNETDEDNPDTGSEIKVDIRDGDDASSTTSEYVLDGDPPSSEPTPMASSSLINSPIPGFYPSSLPSVPAVIPRQIMHTRSSTPSSVSSPLALATPIVPTPSDDPMPPINLDDGPTAFKYKSGKSTPSLLEPRLMITPPMSPKVLAREPSTRRGHRRHSTAANPIFSPASSSNSAPLSPRQSSVAPLARTTPASIKDFDVIKPISKGAFGSVFLAKKKVTGDYYAIKVLKKADMISKNQITNVKAERMILMKQAESPFVAKLYFTFQSKDNLYLVMEYLNGGDCAALIKSIGSLPEEWTKNYIAEVTLGLEYLHERGIVHRDLKPDNLLIDQQGHLKLTDFGLSRIGLLGRQTRESQTGRMHAPYAFRSRPPSMDSAHLASPLMYSEHVGGNSYFNHRNSISRIATSPYVPFTDDIGESSGSESLSGLHVRRNTRTSESPLQSFVTELANDLRTHSNQAGNTPPGEQKFVGTPDYLAPETILGLRGDDAAVDWWALGVITYEFLYGIPPFHADSPERVFENILSGHIEWHDEWVDYRPETRDFMQRLMTLDLTRRLGAHGADEVKAHPFFEGIEWEKVTTSKAAFIPQVSDPESTDYFDPRGAIPQLFQEDEPLSVSNNHSASDSPVAEHSVPAPIAGIPIAMPAAKSEVSTPGSDDFGSFSFKNLPILKQANDDVIRKLKTDQMVPSLTEPSGYHSRKRSISQRLKKPPSVVTAIDQKLISANPPSPATSTSSIASSPSRASGQPSTSGSSAGHSRKQSEYIERFKHQYLEGDRRGSVSSRLRTASVSSAGDGSTSGSDVWASSFGHGSNYFDCHTPPSSVHSIDLKKGPDPQDRAITCLLAEDNPITAKIIETLLIRLGCRCVVVADGSEAVGVAMGDIKFDCILMDLQMPVLDGESAARYIKSTNNKNTSTPIIAVSAYSATDPTENSNIFAAFLSKPLQKATLLAVMRKLGFKTSTVQGGSEPTKLMASLSINNP